MKITNKQKGFSLIELLIVVAIILIIAAIAIPNLLRARMAANESSAVGSLRTIVTSEFNYQQTYGIGYAPLTNLGSTRVPRRRWRPLLRLVWSIPSCRAALRAATTSPLRLRPRWARRQLRTTPSRPLRFRR
jgi:prepilin-type N-terminal cleavage/methylation domain-containing protein